MFRCSGPAGPVAAHAETIQPVLEAALPAKISRLTGCRFIICTKKGLRKMRHNSLISQQPLYPVIR